jgi:hypothetical protein
MIVHHTAKPGIRLLERIAIRSSPGVLRRRDVWLFYLALVLGVGFCVAFSCFLIDLNAQHVIDVDGFHIELPGPKDLKK